MQPNWQDADPHPVIRVLVVDDEESICGLLERAFRARGYVVDSALDADAALDVMEASPAHVALVDIRMPGHDGLWLIKRMQQQYPDTAMIIVTGIPDLDPQITLQRGIAGYVAKPFDPDRVCELVARAVEQYRETPPPRFRMASNSDVPEET